MKLIKPTIIRENMMPLMAGDPAGQKTVTVDFKSVNVRFTASASLHLQFPGAQVQTSLNSDGR